MARCTTADGQTSNRLFGFVGALAVAFVTNRTLIVPKDLRLDDMATVDAAGLLADLGIRLMSQQEFIMLQQRAPLGSQHVAIAQVQREACRRGDVALTKIVGARAMRMVTCGRGLCRRRCDE